MRLIAVVKVKIVYAAGKGDADIVLELSDAPYEEPKTFQAVCFPLFKSLSMTPLQAVKALYEIGAGIDGNSSISAVRGVTVLWQSLSPAQVSLHILSNSNITTIMCSSDSFNFTVLDEYLEHEYPGALQNESTEVSVDCPALGSEPDIIRHDLLFLR